MKCAVCKKNMEEQFLKKIVGTTIKDAKGKRHPICSSCQKEGKEALLQKL
ncbi:MAG: hypothetical protein ABIH34_03820 [Nanoarchaeota archaeon]